MWTHTRVRGQAGRGGRAALETARRRGWCAQCVTCAGSMFPMRSIHSIRDTIVINRSRDQSVDSFSKIMLSLLCARPWGYSSEGIQSRLHETFILCVWGGGALTINQQTCDVLTGGGPVRIGTQEGEGMGSPVGSTGGLKELREPSKYSRKATFQARNSRCKGPEARARLPCLKTAERLALLEQSKGHQETGEGGY